jgi:hypothetical protein
VAVAQARFLREHRSQLLARALEFRAVATEPLQDPAEHLLSIRRPYALSKLAVTVLNLAADRAVYTM